MTGTPDEPPPVRTLAPSLLEAAQRIGWTVAVAESLTGGAVCSALVSVPGASAVVRGGVVAYATDVKASVLGVDAALLVVDGPVCAEVALAMAHGVRALLGADVGLATTGVAGPGAADGQLPGTVFVAVVTPDGQRVRALAGIEGGRAGVRSASVAAVLELALTEVAAHPAG